MPKQPTSTDEDVKLQAKDTVARAHRKCEVSTRCCASVTEGLQCNSKRGQALTPSVIAKRGQALTPSVAKADPGKNFSVELQGIKSLCKQPSL